MHSRKLVTTIFDKAELNKESAFMNARKEGRQTFLSSRSGDRIERCYERG
jgi:hypothetical protein